MQLKGIETHRVNISQNKPCNQWWTPVIAQIKPKENQIKLKE